MRRQGVFMVWAGLVLGNAGPLWAGDAVELSTRVSGVVAEVRVKPGQRVKKGTVLLWLDKTILQAHLDEARAEHVRAQAEEGTAKRDLDQAQELFDRTVSSTSELDLARSRHVRTQAALGVARAHRVIAEKNLQDAELRAPFDGVVNAVPGAPGTVVAADCQPRPLVMFSAQP